MCDERILDNLDKYFDEALADAIGSKEEAPNVSDDNDHSKENVDENIVDTMGDENVFDGIVDDNTDDEDEVLDTPDSNNRQNKRYRSYTNHNFYLDTNCEIDKYLKDCESIKKVVYNSCNKIFQDYTKYKDNSIYKEYFKNDDDYKYTSSNPYTKYVGDVFRGVCIGDNKCFYVIQNASRPVVTASILDFIRDLKMHKRGEFVNCEGEHRLTNIRKEHNTKFSVSSKFCRIVMIDNEYYVELPNRYRDRKHMNVRIVEYKPIDELEDGRIFKYTFSFDEKYEKWVVDIVTCREVPVINKDRKKISLAMSEGSNYLVDQDGKKYNLGVSLKSASTAYDRMTGLLRSSMKPDSERTKLVKFFEKFKETMMRNIDEFAIMLISEYEEIYMENLLMYVLPGKYGEDSWLKNHFWYTFVSVLRHRIRGLKDADNCKLILLPIGMLRETCCECGNISACNFKYNTDMMECTKCGYKTKSSISVARVLYKKGSSIQLR